ncbi:Ig-like domain-containing protein [Paenibacillus dakarensis]|uniref:Ig-like domain-containing protein n=1 Tax=Paenibacillus dakarensis TaxID=1527293 RepID=UPI0006D565BC|nr:Ig-like domain-containing protein [Paenibacillus dakarensis]
MSNKSYHFNQIKENNQVSIQGGEKKVMKKILSVALSTAMAFSMFASVAFGDDAKLTPQQKFDVLQDAKILAGYPDGSAHLEKDLTRAEFAKVVSSLMGLKPITGQLSFKDKGYTAKNWAVPYIEAVYSAGLMEGKNTTKMIFDYNGKITVQEMAAVLVRALKLEQPTETNNDASAWAKGYVQAAVNAGIIDSSATPKANATRSQMVDTAYAIWVDQQQPKVVSYEVKEDGKVVEFKLANDSVVKVTLEKALVANTETVVSFENGGYKYSEKVTWVVTTATKVDSASATNLKEVVVKFNGEVDRDSAENAANYTLRSGKIIDSVSLSDDNTTATLLLKTSPLNNNKTDAVSVSNIKAGSATISATNVEFTAVDNALPEVSSVVSLGTKSVKVVFSEPVKNASQSNFTLDGKEFFGKVTVSNNYRTVVLTPYNTSALAVGEHKLTVSGVKDFADFVSLASSHDITVVEDKTAPTIAEATATLESVTITFSEDVDVDTIDAGKVYWKSGSNKITAVSPKQLADNKWRFNFGVEKSLPTGPVSIFVEGVKDYSGNVIAADTSVVVTPEIDQTRPVVNAVSAENAREIKITFSKAVNETSAETKGNYTVKDEDGKSITVREAVRDNLDHRVVRVYLYTDLSVGGDNTLTIQNVKDDTKLQNTILDYTGKVNLADKAAPKFDSTTVNTDERRVVIKFNKKMDVESLANYSNYLVQIDNQFQPLTSGIAEITPFQDGTAVSIKFAESIGNKIVDLADGVGAAGYTHINALTVLGVKDLNGNVLAEFTQGGSVNKIDLTEDTVIALDGKAELVDRRTVKVKFNSGINNYASGAFVNQAENAPGVSSVEVNGTSTVLVKFNGDLNTDGSNLDLRIDLSKLVTNAGNANGGLVDVSAGDANLKDSVKPVVQKPSNNADVYPFPVEYTNGVASFEITFSEQLKTNANVASDFKIYRNTDNKELLIAEDQFTASATGNKVTITLNDTATRKVDTEYRVEVKDARLITDIAGNAVANFDGISAEVEEGATSVLEKAVADAQADLNAAKADTTAAQTAVTDATNAKTAADTALVAAKAATTAAQTAVTNATEEKEEAQAAYDAAVAALLADPSNVTKQEAATTTQQTLNQKILAESTAKAELLEATTAQEAAQEAADDAAADLTSAQATLTAKKAAEKEAEEALKEAKDALEEASK